jgi:hypothetical protein
VASDRWSLCQNLVQATVEFDEKSQHQPGNLQTIEFACLALCITDTLTVVSKLLLVEQQTPSEVTAELPQAQQAEAVADTSTELTDNPSIVQQASQTWYPVEKLLQKQIRKEVEYYLVIWTSGEPASWDLDRTYRTS